MNDLHLVDCVERGLRLYWHTLAKARGMELHEGDVEYVVSTPRGSGPERAFSIHLLSESAQERVDEIITAIRSGAMPDSIIVTPTSTPPNLIEVLVWKGFSIDTSGRCMALDLEGFADTGQAGSIDIIEVSDEERLGEWAGIVNRAFEGEVMTSEQFLDVYNLDSTHFYLASVQGAAASGCMTITDGDLATLELVATLKEHRRKGLATAVVSAALRQLRQRNVRVVTLRAEPDGIGVYQNLGFKECFRRVVASFDIRDRAPQVHDAGTSKRLSQQSRSG